MMMRFQVAFCCNITGEPPRTSEIFTGKIDPLKVINIMKRFCPTMERSSIDECYLDLTEISRRYRNATDKSQLPNCWLSGCETVEESVEAIIDSGPSSDFSVQVPPDCPGPEEHSER